MLSRLVRLLLLAELLAYAGVGAWLHLAHGWSIASVVAGATGLSLGSRLVFVLASFAVSGATASARPPGSNLALVEKLRMWGREFKAVLGSNFLGVPFPALVTPKETLAEPGTRIPVILVHGYFGNRGFFGPLLRWLARQGIAPVFAPDFPATFATIEDFAVALEAEVERICQATGQPRVILVCHSMGGLATRRYLANRGAERVAKVVTIASPHAGTALSAFGLGRNAAQMRMASKFLVALRLDEGGRAPCPFISIYSIDDNMVSPQETSRLGWAQNVALHAVGHITILQSRRTYSVLLDELGEAGVRAGR